MQSVESKRLPNFLGKLKLTRFSSSMSSSSVTGSSISTEASDKDNSSFRFSLKIKIKHFNNQESFGLIWMQNKNMATKECLENKTNSCLVPFPIRRFFSDVEHSCLPGRTEFG